LNLACGVVLPVDGRRLVDEFQKRLVVDAGDFRAGIVVANHILPSKTDGKIRKINPYRQANFR
jgi:hypothetical protein